MSIVAFELEGIERIHAFAKTKREETCAVGLVARAGTRAGKPRFVVRDFVAVPDSAYLARSNSRASLSPQFLVDLANRARKQGLGVILGHTHPGPGALAHFSAIDDEGERSLREYYERRVPGQHFSVVITENQVHCRHLGHGKSVDTQLIGKHVRLHRPNADRPPETDDRYDRQVRAFGPEWQTILSKLRIGIVGLGGMGSIIAHELVHLGVTDFLLIDPDIVEQTNLNRLLGANSEDVGVAKVIVADRSIRSVNATVSSDAVIGNVVDAHIAKLLIDTDFIFLCTDSHASRATVNQLAYQYLIPCIDMGVAIHAENGKVRHVVGRTQMLSSGLACLLCADWLDAHQIRREMMSEEQRRSDPYFVGVGTPQPAVVSLNGAIASVAITTFLAAMTSFPADARMVLYDAVLGTMRPTIVTPQANCLVCSREGASARGDSWPLAARETMPLE